MGAALRHRTLAIKAFLKRCSATPFAGRNFLTGFTKLRFGAAYVFLGSFKSSFL
jgi:hypothetical protein